MANDSGLKTVERMSYIETERPDQASYRRHKAEFNAPAIAPRGRSSPVSARLPFTIRVARTEQQLLNAVKIRYQAYSRHLPQFADKLQDPEPLDTHPGTIILLAESRLDGTPLGTVRIQTNHYEPLAVEQYVPLAPELQHQSLAELTRLGVTGDRGARLVTHALIKALCLVGIAMQVDAFIATARRPLDRVYASMGYVEMYPGMGFVPLPQTGNVPHKILVCPISGGERIWHSSDHPLHNFMVNTFHPDIQVFSSISGAAWRPRSQTQNHEL